jgi:hypothetical protein
MAMTNAERQRKYRQRRNDLARRAEKFDRRFDEMRQDLVRRITIEEIIQIVELQGPERLVLLAGQTLDYLKRRDQLQVTIIPPSPRTGDPPGLPADIAQWRDVTACLPCLRLSVWPVQKR